MAKTMILGFVVVAFVWGGAALIVKEFADGSAGFWFYTGAMSVILATVVVVKFSKEKEAGDEREN